MAINSDRLLREFGKHLQQLRIDKGYSTRKFADEADISPSSLGRLEAGQTNPRLITLLKVAEALGVDMNTLTLKIKR